MRLAGRVAIVTGASAGIGRAVARRFAEEGADLTLAALDRVERMEEDAREFRAKGRRALVLELDVGRLPDLERMVAETARELGRVDILVNNAGLRLYKPFWEVTEAEWDRMMAVDLKAYFFASKLVVPHMREGGWGRIIHVASQLGHVGHAGAAVYCAAKGALVNLTRAMALELAPLGIAVNAISPGPIVTEHHIARYAKDPEGREARLRQIPLGRFGEPGEVAGVALFLASEEASFIHGASLVVDGGYIAQ